MRSIALATILILGACSGGNTDGNVETQSDDDIATTQTENGSTTSEIAADEPRFYADPRRVQIGFDGPDFDACGSYGEITGLDPQGDNFLSVRAAPTTEAEELDRLTTGTGVSLCETAPGWLGIVYERSGEAGSNCETGSPVPNVRDYDGPCRSGWVSQRFVELIAG